MHSLIKSKKFMLISALMVAFFLFLLAWTFGKIKVEAFRIKRIDSTKGVTITGTVQSPEDVGIEASFTAKIKKMLVDKGYFVKKGQILSILDKQEVIGNLITSEGQLESSKAQVKNLETEPRIQQANIAKSQLEENQNNINVTQQELIKTKVQLKDALSDETRNLKLYQEGAVSFRDYEKTANLRKELQAGVESINQQIQAAKSRLNQAKQNLSLILAGTKSEQIEAAKAQVKSAVGGIQSTEGRLDNYTIRAPFNGYIAQKIMDVGEVTSTTSPIMRLIKPDNLYINAQVEENQMKDIQLGQNAIIVFDAYPGEMFTGEVFLVSKNVDPITGTFDVRIRLPIIKNRPIVVGMTSDVTVITKKIQKGIIIPAEFVSIQNKKKYVFVKKGNTAVKTYIDCYKFSNDKFIVTKGLKENAIIVKSLDTKKLHPNDRVKIQTYTTGND